MRNRILLIAVAVFLAGPFQTCIRAQNIPESIGFQGILTGTDGQPVADGTYSVVFKIYTVASGEVGPLFTSTPVNVTTQGGLFVTQIPGPFSPVIFFAGDRFLETVVDGETLAPRAKLASVPWALNADQLDGNDSTAFLKSVPIPLNLSGTAPQGGAIISGTNDSTNEGIKGVFGYASAVQAGSTFGVYGQSDSNRGGIGVFGIGAATIGNATGGRFESNSPIGAGVVGIVNPTGLGGGVGVYGASNAIDGRGVAGEVRGTGQPKAIVGDSSLNPNGYAGYFLGRGYFSGNVGIGTTTPSMPLHIRSGEPVLILQDSGTAATQSGYLGFWNNNPSETAWVGFGTPGSPHFSVVNARSTGHIILSPGSSANVGINTSSPTFKLHVNGSVAGIGAYNNLSDARVKLDIKPIAGALDKVARLHGVSFDWKRTQYPEIDFPQGRQIGVIGQEVAKVLPECVTRDDKGYISVAYGSLVPVLIEAIREQQQQIETMKSDNKRLEDKLEEMEALKTQIARIAEALREQSHIQSLAATPH